MSWNCSFTSVYPFFLMKRSGIAENVIHYHFRYDSNTSGRVICHILFRKLLHFPLSLTLCEVSQHLTCVQSEQERNFRFCSGREGKTTKINFLYINIKKYIYMYVYKCIYKMYKHVYIHLCTNVFLLIIIFKI